MAKFNYKMSPCTGEMMMRQSTPEPESNQMFEKDTVTDTEPGAFEGVTKIPEQSKNDLESRQQQIIAPQNSSRLVVEISVILMEYIELCAFSGLQLNCCSY